MTILFCVVLIIALLLIVFVFRLFSKLALKNTVIHTDRRNSDEIMQALYQEAQSVSFVFSQRWPDKSFARRLWHVQTWVCPAKALEAFCHECACYTYDVFDLVMERVSPRLCSWVFQNLGHETVMKLLGICESERM